MTIAVDNAEFERAAADGGRQAVIDIGSNSVRLVVYDGPKRAPFPICNEKALCGLGRGMEEDGLLNAEAVEMALLTLARFRKLLIEHGDPPLRIIATAAVREARNGAAFVADVRKLGFDLQVIPGEEEARLSALGVVSFEPGATGLVGDMGGGSLELIALEDGNVKEAESLSIGPFRLMERSKGDLKKAANEADAAVEKVAFLRKSKYATLFAVGGAWRAVARLHMRFKNHPLQVLHHYELAGKQAIEICELIARQSKTSLEDMRDVSPRRLETLPFAALVLRSVLAVGRIERLVVSAGGLREGVLYNDLDAAERRVDPLIAGAGHFGARLAPDPDMGAAVARLTDGVFAGEVPAMRRLRLAACLMTDVGAYFHPDLRGEQAFDTALRAPFYGVTHAERAVIATALFCRHEGSNAPHPSPAIFALMSEAQAKLATRIGLALRFASAYAPKASHAIERCTLKVEGERLLFAAPSQFRALMDETPRRRLEALAAAMSLRADIAYV